MTECTYIHLYLCVCAPYVPHPLYLVEAVGEDVLDEVEDGAEEARRVNGQDLVGAARVVVAVHLVCFGGVGGGGWRGGGGSFVWLFGCSCF